MLLQWQHDVITRTELRILRLDWVTADPLPHIDSPYVSFRVSAALSKTSPTPVLRTPRPNLPSELAEKLASDPEDRVRRTVATHRNLPLPALLQLLADPSEHVAEAAAACPFLPSSTWSGC